MGNTRKWTSTPAAMRSTAYAELWGIVDGAVVDAFNNHPDYLTSKGQQSARTSVVKRVTGTVLSFAEQSARGRRQPADTPDGASFSHPAGEAAANRLPNPHCRIGRITFRRSASSRILTEFNVTTNRLREAVQRAVTMPNRLPPSPRVGMRGESA